MSDEIEVQNNVAAEDAQSNDAKNANLESADDQALEKNESADSDSEDDSDEIPEKYQRKIGEIISKERKRMQIKYQSQSNASVVHQAPQAPEGQIYDKQIKQFVDVNSIVGQIALREQLAEEQRLLDRQSNETLSKKQRDAELTEEINEGFNNSRYPNYVNAVEHFQQYGNDSMFYALEGVDNKSAVVNYFADKKGEVQRIARLTPAKQMREFIKIEENLSPRKKLITNASAPVKKVSGDGVKVGVRANDMSYDQMRTFYESKFNRR